MSVCVPIPRRSVCGCSSAEFGLSAAEEKTGIIGHISEVQEPPFRVGDVVP